MTFALSSSPKRRPLPFSPLLLRSGVGKAPIDPRLLGIEVTDPVLAAACGLGNIDPQHAPGAPYNAPAAIEACVDVPLPVQGSRLATIRPDLDAIGSMAVLNLRALGFSMGDKQMARVRRIAAIDRFERGPWPGKRPLPLTRNDLIDDWPGADLACLAACLCDAARTIEERVGAAMRWIETGDAPIGYWNVVLAQKTTLLRSLHLGTTRVEEALDGKVSVVVSLHSRALELGYRRAPVVLALNPGFRFSDGHVGRKYTLSRWSEGDADLNRAVEAISAFEQGWGGQRGIKGSPQSRPSELSLENVTQSLRSALVVKME